MPLGQTPALQIDLMAEGDNNKYLLSNDAIQRLEDSFHKELAIDLTAANYTLTESDLVNNGVFVCSGQTVARDLTIPLQIGSPAVNVTRVIFVRNAGTASGAITVKHPTGLTVTVAIGATSIIRANGTDVVLLGSVGGTLGALSDVTETAPALGQVIFYDGGAWINDNGNYRRINDQTGTSYTLVLADAGKIVRLDNASAITLTVPTNASVAYGIGTTIKIRQAGAGAVTLVGAGPPILNTPTDLILNGIGDTATLVKVATDEWDVIKDQSGVLGINNQSGTTYTLILSDARDIVRLDNAAAITLTVPTNASVAFPIGTEIYLRQVGAGTITISGGGVTFNTPDDLIMGSAGETAKLVKVATDEWDVVKDVTGASGGFTWGVNNQTGTAYTLALGDEDKVIRCANASPFTLTVPTNAIAAFAVGSQIRIAETGTGIVTVAGAGVILNTADDLILGNQHEQLILIKIATDEWDVVKDQYVIDPTAVNTQTGTAYTLALTDAEDIVEMSNAAANVLTIPTNAAAAFAVGVVISITRLGVGITTITGDTGVTVNGVSAGGAIINNQYQGVSLYKRATDEWIMQGAHGTVA